MRKTVLERLVHGGPSRGLMANSGLFHESTGLAWKAYGCWACSTSVLRRIISSSRYFDNLTYTGSNAYLTIYTLVKVP